MSAEDFDCDGIDALERGAPLPESLADDREALAAADRHQQLVRHLGDATGGSTPSAGWQDRVWQGIADEADRHRRRDRTRLVLIGLAVVGVVVGAVVLLLNG